MAWDYKGKGKRRMPPEPIYKVGREAQALETRGGVTEIILGESDPLLQTHQSVGEAILCTHVAQGLRARWPKRVLFHNAVGSAFNMVQVLV